jgi:hypothetical protein
MCRLFHRLALGHIHGLASRKTTETGGIRPGCKKFLKKSIGNGNPSAGVALFAAERRSCLANARIREVGATATFSLG